MLSDLIKPDVECSAYGDKAAPKVKQKYHGRLGPCGSAWARAFWGCSAIFARPQVLPLGLCTLSRFAHRISCRPSRVAMRPCQINIEAVTAGFRDTFLAI